MTAVVIKLFFTDFAKTAVSLGPCRDGLRRGVGWY
jgi:hypothetical protein